MPDYQKGKIYQIVAPDGTKYIGSTTKSLSIRFSTHKCDYKRHIENKRIMRSTCLKLFELFNYSQLKIELIENYPCNTKKELNKREGEIIRVNTCVNKRVEGRTTEEYTKDTIENRKLKRIENIDKFKIRDKEYYIKNCQRIKERELKKLQENRDSINKRRRELRLINKDHVNQRQKEYRLKHREELNARRRKLKE
jgi:hypothetical protein